MRLLFILVVAVRKRGNWNCVFAPMSLIGRCFCVHDFDWSLGMLCKFTSLLLLANNLGLQL